MIFANRGLYALSTLNCGGICLRVHAFFVINGQNAADEAVHCDRVRG